MSALQIRDVRAFCVTPGDYPLVVVKVETSEPGLYGLGCATMTTRAAAVKVAVDEFLKPFLVGKDPERIEDIWHSTYVSTYFRNSPLLNSALSGVDIALWDIKGKIAGLPVYELLGGKCREAAAIYRHADGLDEKEVEDQFAAFKAEGYHHIRVQLGGYGGHGEVRAGPQNRLPGAYFDPDAYARSIPKLFERIRTKFGEDIELLHDAHSRLVPMRAVQLAKELEKYRLFFLEDALPPEQSDWLRIMRNQTSTPLALGELFCNPAEWLPLVRDRLIDFTRAHISCIGGITPAKKMAHVCEAFGVRTAWHGPPDVSPIGHMANLHLDLSSLNFGIQEWSGFTDIELEMFPGCPEARGGYFYANDKPGLGIDFDEKLASRYDKFDPKVFDWTLARTPDGTSVCP